MYRFSSSFFFVYYLKHKNLDFTCYRKNGKELFFFKQYFSYKFIFFTIWLVFFSFFIFLSKKIKKKKTFENSGGSWLIVFPFLSSLYIIIHYLVSCDLICGAMFLVSQSLLWSDHGNKKEIIFTDEKKNFNWRDICGQLIGCGRGSFVPSVTIRECVFFNVCWVIGSVEYDSTVLCNQIIYNFLLFPQKKFPNTSPNLKINSFHSTIVLPLRFLISFFKTSSKFHDRSADISCKFFFFKKSCHNHVRLVIFFRIINTYIWEKPLWAIDVGDASRVLWRVIKTRVYCVKRAQCWQLTNPVSSRWTKRERVCWRTWCPHSVPTWGPPWVISLAFQQDRVNDSNSLDCLLPGGAQSRKLCRSWFTASSGLSRPRS